MTIDEALKTAARRLLPSLNDLNQAWAEAELLLAKATKKRREWTLAHPEKRFSPVQTRRFKHLIERRRKLEPMAYLLGATLFDGRHYLSHPGVLIPRPETEELVALALSKLKSHSSKPLVWDVGTGCGAIAVTVKAQRPSTTVFASDVDGKALALAKRNAKKILHRSSAIKFFHANLLAKPIQTAILKHPAEQIFIIANLPYLPLSDKKILSPGVVKYEPARALFTKKHGNFLIHKLLQQIAKHRLIDSRPISLFIEFDPPQAKTLRSLAQQYFPDANISIHTDACGRERFLKILIEK